MCAHVQEGPKESIASGTLSPEKVERMFDRIAPVYDLMNRVMTAGLDQRWRKATVRAVVQPGDRVLDAACGTGDLAVIAAKAGGNVTGLDFSERMLERARRKAPGLEWVRGDMLALPFPPASFDIVTTGYGLRNVPDLAAAIDEIGRVLAPGGQLLSLDFNRPSNAIVRGAYLAYLGIVGGALGWALHRDPDTYRYIPASIRQYPGADAVARMFEARGFRAVRSYRVLGGLMAIHHAVRR
jgi:demethylmenaquinone methyltransferase/2-methoxy-6-polyprenyl-1,4-benzoquinol methylase